MEKENELRKFRLWELSAKSLISAINLHREGVESYEEVELRAYYFMKILEEELKENGKGK